MLGSSGAGLMPATLLVPGAHAHHHCPDHGRAVGPRASISSVPSVLARPDRRVSATSAALHGDDLLQPCFLPMMHGGQRVWSSRANRTGQCKLDCRSQLRNASTGLAIVRPGEARRGSSDGHPLGLRSRYWDPNPAATTALR